MDTKMRSWAKSIVWRLVGIVILGGISYAFTRNLKEVAGITGIFHGLRFLLYYVHERAWEKVDWGKVKHPLANLPVKQALTPEDEKIIADKLRELGYLE